MARVGLTICGAAALVLLGACQRAADRPAEAPAAPAATPAAGAPIEGFIHPRSLDLFGYYMPTAELKVGRWKLNHLHVGSVAEFDEWTAGRRPGTYAPVMMQFDDLESPTTVNELGQTVHTVTERVLPDAWRVSETEIVFVDLHPRLGQVRFEGRLDPAALARARKGEGDAVVLTGTLTVAGQVFRDVKFTWFGGD